MSQNMPISWHAWQQSNALNDILCFQRKFKCSPHSNSAIQLPIQPSELIKKHAHKCPITGVGHLHEKMLQPQTTSLGSSHTHVTARKACQTMCIINHSLFHMHGCANRCHETSSTLVHRQLAQWSLPLPMPFPTLWPLFLPPSDMHFTESRLSIHHKLPYQAAFTSAPFWRRISTTSLCPFLCW